MAVTNADILGWLNANPGADAALINQTMAEAGVSAAQYQSATGAPPPPVAPTTVTELYQQVLGRPPESQAVVDEWTRQFGSTIDPTEVAQFEQAAQLEKTNPAAANIKGQLLSQWSKLGVTELPGGISLEERASALADTMKQNGITNLADLKLGSKTIQTGEDGGTTNASFLSNKGQQLGFLGNVNENLKNKADYLQPDNLLSWSSEGKGNVGYKAVETADGGVAIVPQWNSSSDLKTVRNIAKLAAAVYFGGMGLESLGATGTAGAGAAGLTAAEAAGLGLTAAEAAALGLSASEFAAAGGLGAGFTAAGLPSGVGTFLGENVVSGIPAWDAAFTGAGGLFNSAFGLPAGNGAFLGEGVPSGVPAWDTAYTTAGGVFDPAFALGPDGLVGNPLPPITSPVIPPTSTPSTNFLNNLTPGQIANIVGGVGGLLGGAGVARAVTGGGGTGGGVGALPTQGVPLNTADYYNAIQQNYNRLLPAVPRDVATPLAQWYNSTYGA